MHKIKVHCVAQNESMSIILTINGKLRTLNRPKEEQLAKVLFRIKQSAAPQRPKGNRPQDPESEAAQCVLVCGDKVVQEDVPNHEAWTHGNVLQLGDVFYVVEVNPPTADEISLPPRPLVGIPQRPSAALRFVDHDACAWQWLRREKSPDGPAPTPSTSHSWEEIPGAQQSRYTPQKHDVGFMLKVRCTPARFMSGQSTELCRPSLESGDPVEAVCEDEVANWPVPCAGHGRQSLTQQVLSSPRLRVVCYNLLASMYADTEQARTHLFPYVSSLAMDSEYRRQLQLQELLGFNADILCLQEVDTKIFERYLEPHLRDEGFGGIFLKKKGSVREGEALFFRRSRFFMAEQRSVELRRCFQAPATDDGSLHVRFRALLEHSSAAGLREILTQRLTTVAQIVLLCPAEEGGEGSGGGSVAVVNTHLFYHPGASHIRMLQAAAIAAEVEAAVAAWRGEGRGRVAVVFCGDLNSEPDTGAMQLLVGGKVRAAHPEWAAHSNFTWGGGEDESEGGESGETGGAGAENGAVREVEGAHGGGEVSGVARGMELEHGLELASADGLESTYTNYVRGYIGCLDYILYQPREMELEQWVPLPPETELRATALPSPRFPSDHLSLCADFCWRPDSVAAAPRDGEEAERAAAHEPPAAEPQAAPPASAPPDGVAARYPARLWQRRGVRQPASPFVLYKAVRALGRGALVAVPTDRGYALVAALSSEDAVRRLAHIGGRGLGSSARTMCLAGAEHLERWVHLGGVQRAVLAELLAAGAGLVMGLQPEAACPAEVAAAVSAGEFGAAVSELRGEPAAPSGPHAAGRSTAILRLPGADPNPRTSQASFSFCRALAAQCGGAVAMLETSYASAEELEVLWDHLSFVFDGGVLPNAGAEATVVELTDVDQAPPRYRLLRAGAAPNDVEAALRRHGVCKAK